MGLFDRARAFIRGLREGAEIANSLNTVVAIAQEEGIVDKMPQDHVDTFVEAHRLLRDHENRDQIIRELIRTYAQHKKRNKEEIVELMMKHLSRATRREHIIALHRTLRTLEEHNVPHEHRAKILRAIQDPEDLVKVANALEKLERMNLKHLQPEALLAAIKYDKPGEFLERSAGDVEIARKKMSMAFNKISELEPGESGPNRYEMLAILGKDYRLANAEGKNAEKEYIARVRELSTNGGIRKLAERRYEL